MVEDIQNRAATLDFADFLPAPDRAVAVKEQHVYRAGASFPGAMKKSGTCTDSSYTSPWTKKIPWSPKQVP